MRIPVRPLARVAALLGLAGAALLLEPPPLAAQGTPRPTTQTNDGMATFHNTNCGGQTRFILLRIGRNDQDREMLLVLSANQQAKVGVPKSSTWLANCGQPPADNGKFGWIALDEI
ncbi:MAG: hypothetical protein U1E23_05075 [Reyranellaceae bacterium]